jgi:iron-sulfur cluster repair protein YtfE (RIC family)
MRPSEIRRRVLTDHEALRGHLVGLEKLTRSVDRETTNGQARALRDDARALLEELSNHMRWEEHYLLPALRDADAWGEERARRLIGDHREQRQVLDLIIERLRDSGRPEALVVRDVFGLIAFLREDMDEEERDLLDPRVLRDDVVGIDVETG